MVSALDSGSSAPGWCSSWPGHCFVFLGKAMNSHSASLSHECWGMTCDGLASHPWMGGGGGGGGGGEGEGGVKLLLAA